jgi:hypothetical protein
MTPEEIRVEQNHLYQTRLAILCGTANPTPEQEAIARQEAMDWARAQEPRAEMKQPTLL